MPIDPVAAVSESPAEPAPPRAPLVVQAPTALSLLHKSRRLAEVEHAAKVRRALLSASCLAEVDYRDPVMWEDCPIGHDDEPPGYFFNLDSLREHAEREGVTLPSWVWACSSRSLTLDAESIIDAWLGPDFAESAQVSPDAVKALQTVLDLWCGREDVQQDTRSWEEDRGRVVVLDPVAFEALVASLGEEG